MELKEAARSFQVPIDYNFKTVEGSNDELSKNQKYEIRNRLRKKVGNNKLYNITQTFPNGRKISSQPGLSFGDNENGFIVIKGENN